MINLAKIKLFFDEAEKWVKRVVPFYGFLFFLIQIIFWTAVTFLLTFYLAKKSNLADKPFGVSDLILLITAAFILFYTYETQKMRKQAEATREAEFMPVIIFDRAASNAYDMQKLNHNHRNSGFTLQITNVGKGLAKEIYFFIDGHLVLKNQDKISLEANGEFVLTFHVKDLPEEIIKKFENNVKDFHIRLEYEDIFGHMFCTESSFDRRESSYRISSKWQFFKV